MRSAEFEHGPYTIKTFIADGEVKARVFLGGTWFREVGDWSAASIDEVLQRIRQSIDTLEETLEDVLEGSDYGAI